MGPDAGSPSPELGPAKYETATIITSAGNQGWPYCMGNKQPYRDRSNEDASVLTGWYDCDNPKNTSPRNTGLVDLPPVRNNMIWYSPSGGGPVFPDRGNGIPTYEDDEATYTIRGCGAAARPSCPVRRTASRRSTPSPTSRGRRTGRASGSSATSRTRTTASR